MPTRDRIVVLGSMTKMPVAGVVWQVLHYLVGLERLGYETYYVEADARTPSMLMSRPSDNSSELAAGFLGRILGRFGFRDRWAFHALHDDGRCFGMSHHQLSALYNEASVIINLHGGTLPRDELTKSGRLVYLETDPVELQLEIDNDVTETIQFLEAHVAHFTFAENYGLPGCLLPASDRFSFIPTRQPVVLEFWADPGAIGSRFTTIGNWKQLWRPVQFEEETLLWSKHQQFEKVLSLPKNVSSRFELALSSIDLDDVERLEAHGWQVRDGLDVSTDIDDYRAFIGSSLGEFTVAKEQNVRLRTGWFSDRSATYLASARPVITQDTGYGSVLPVGCGLLPFLTSEEAAEAVTQVEHEVARHSAGAREIAREYFAHDVVLVPLLEEIGLSAHRRRSSPPSNDQRALSSSLDLVPVRKRPTTLSADTIDYLRARPVFDLGTQSTGEDTGALTSVIVVTYDNLPFLRLCLESVLTAAVSRSFELVVVDNGCTDGTHEYLDQLQARNPQVRHVDAHANLGFPAGVNLGVRHSGGDTLVFLNDDTIVGPSWLDLLCQKLSDPSIGMVAPMTNHPDGGCRETRPYANYGEFLALAASRAEGGHGCEVPFLAMFCVALRREVYDAVGPLDEQYELGLFDDDDYCLRLQMLGFTLWCADSVFVHHFGQVSLGKLAPSGQYGRLFTRNLRRFERKWEVQWCREGGEPIPGYTDLVERIRALTARVVPTGESALVISRGDSRMLEVAGVNVQHFPQGEDGRYAGHYPANGSEAVGGLVRARRRGAQFLVVPTLSIWWLEFYKELDEYLAGFGPPIVDLPDTGMIFNLGKVSR